MSARQLYYNNIDSTLAAEALAGATVLQIASAVFPSVTAPDFYLATLESVSGDRVEIVKIVAVTGTSITVERGYEGTAQDFVVGDIIQVRSTAGTFSRFGQQTDLGASFPFVAAVVDTALDVYIDPAGDDTSGDGSQSAPWATLYKALVEVGKLRFADNGACTIQCAAGVYPMNAQLRFDHPQGVNITIKGAAGFSTITGMPIVDYSVDRNNPTGSTIPGATEFANTAGTLPQNTLSATRATAIDADRVNNRAVLAATATTIFQWATSGTDEPKALIQSTLGLLDQVGFEFATPGSTLDNRAGICVTSGASLTVTDVTVVGGATGIKVEDNASLRANTIAIANAFNNFVCDTGGNATVQNAYIQGAVEEGIYVRGASVMSVQNLVVAGCNARGIRVTEGASVNGDTATWTISNCLSNGLSLDTCASTTNRSQLVVTTGHGDSGVGIANSASMNCGELEAVGNLRGLFMFTQGTVLITSTTPGAPDSRFNNNAQYGCLGQSSGTLEVLGGAVASDNDLDGVRLEYGASIIVDDAFTLKGNTGQAFRAIYAGPCDLGELVCDTTNLISPHLSAIGGTHVNAVAPGAGGVAADVVYSPPFGTTAAPDSALFT